MVLKVSLNTGINRIRLEFKVFSLAFILTPTGVLIESDWNLKSIAVHLPFSVSACINRIRLEFKGDQERTSRGYHSVLIESDWNLKDFGALK